MNALERTVLHVLIGAIVFFISVRIESAYRAPANPVALATTYPGSLNSPPLPPGFIQLPGDNVFAGGQLPAADLARFITQHRISTVIRLDLERASWSILSPHQERIITTQLNASYHEFIIDLNAQDLIPSSLDSAFTIMSRGRTLVHCLHGRHRSMAVAGHYLAHNGYSFPQIIHLLDWQEIVNNPTYAKYTNHVRNETLHQDDR